MKHFLFEDHWDAIKVQLKERFSELKDSDLNLAAGKGEALFNRLREKLGLSVHDLNALLEELEANATSRLEHVRAKAADLVEEVRDRFDTTVDEIKAKGVAAAEEAKAQAGIAYQEARQRVRSMRKEGEEYVRQNPRESLVAALCAGFVAGLLIRR